MLKSFKLFLEELTSLQEGKHSDIVEAKNHNELLDYLEQHANPKDSSDHHYADTKAAGLREAQKRYAHDPEFKKAANAHHKSKGREGNYIEHILKYHSEESPSPYVRKTAAKLSGSEVKPLKVVKPKAEVEPKSTPKKSSEKEVKIDPSIHPEGKLTAVKGDPTESGADEVTHIKHTMPDGTSRHVATISSSNGTHNAYLIKNGKQELIKTNSAPKSHNEAKSIAVREIRSTQY